MPTRPTEISRLNVSIYEIERDLSGWRTVYAHQVPNFVRGLAQSGFQARELLGECKEERSV